MNVQGCNDPAKRECVGRMFEERGLGVLVMTETKLRGRGECSFGRYVGRISGVSSGWAREGVGIIVSDEWMKHVTEWKEVSSRIMYENECWWVKASMSLWVRMVQGLKGKRMSERVFGIIWGNWCEVLKVMR